MKISKYSKDDSISYTLGATVTMEYLLHEAGSLTRIFFHPDFKSDSRELIEELANKHGIEITTDVKPFNILSQKENCFVIGVIKKSREQIKAGNHVVLVNPSNCGNLGTIIRRMGALARVNIEVFASFEEYQKRFPENNCYPFMLDGSTLLQETVIKAPFSLIMGNEATGLPPEFKNVGQPVRIEHTDNIDSLNLPIATSIGLYEATKSVFKQK